MYLEETIAQRVFELHRQQLDDQTRHIIKRNIIDSFASICGSMNDRELLAGFDRLVSGVASGADLPVWGIGRLGSYADAIFANTIMARRSDLLSTYLSPNNMGGVHPSDNVALALVVADWQKLNGEELVQLVHTMFFLSLSFATYFDPETADYDHDAAATFITALAIGCALGCAEEELVRTQRIAGMLGLDINQAGVGQITDWKHCTFASCAARGLQAVKLARAGFQAPPSIYEGTAGVNRFMPHADTFFEPPPDLERIILKRWPALVFCQTPIDVAMDLAPQISDIASIKSVTVSTYDLSYRNGAIASAYQPTSRAGRTHSIPYCVATCLLKPLCYEDFDEPWASTYGLNDLMARIEVINDPDLTAACPAKSQCIIEVLLEDGSTVRGSRDFPKGDPADPLSDKDIEEKFNTYCFFTKSEPEKNAILEKLWHLEEQSNVDWMTSPLQQRLIPEG